MAKHSELGSKNLNKIWLKIIQKALKQLREHVRFSKIFRGSMPPDLPTRAFRVSQSASN